MGGVLYIDESGDAGFKFDSTNPVERSSELLVVGSVYFPTKRHLRVWKYAHKVWDVILEREAKRGLKREFKFSAEAPKVRDGFARAALTAPGWKWNALVVQKEWLIAQHQDPELWYRRAIRYLLNNASQRADPGTAVRIDSRSFPGNCRDLLLAEIAKPTQTAHAQNPPELVSDFYVDPRFLDSKESAGVQLADFIAGAAARQYRSWKTRTNRWLIPLHQRPGYLQAWPKRKPAV